jgi:hypothetical protein
MKIYLVGNFDLLVYPKKEREMYDRINVQQKKDYNRLVSYFNVDKLNGIVELKYEHENIEAPCKKPKEFVNSIGAKANKKAQKAANKERVNKDGLERA